MREFAVHLAAIFIVIVSLGSCQNSEELSKDSGKYIPDWESLSEFNEAPDWFKDAKLGIYSHWGPQSLGNLGMENGAGW